MSAPAKEPQPLGSTSGKRGYIRVCVRCGKELQGVGRNAKYCPACRAEVNREKALDCKARNPEKVRAAYERRKAATWTPVYCQRCGCEIVNATTHRQKWCPDCIRAIKSQQSRQSYIRRHKADTTQAQPKEEPLELLSNVAIWAGISYGKLMLKSPAEREALILAYTKPRKDAPHEQNRLRPADRCAAGAGRLAHPTDVRPGPCGGQHPPVKNKRREKK